MRKEKRRGKNDRGSIKSKRRGKKEEQKWG